MAKIVVGIDGSDASKRALRWAIDEARLRKVHVLALHAWEPPPIAPDLAPAPMPPPRDDLAALLPQLREAADELVKSAVAEVAGEGSDVDVRPVAQEGPASVLLVGAAEDDDLVVVGSRGRSSLAALVLGSVSQQVAQQSPCPVVICPKPS